MSNEELTRIRNAQLELGKLLAGHSLRINALAVQAGMASHAFPTLINPNKNPPTANADKLRNWISGLEREFGRCLPEAEMNKLKPALTALEHAINSYNSKREDEKNGAKTAQEAADKAAREAEKEARRIAANTAKAELKESRKAEKAAKAAAKEAKKIAANTAKAELKEAKKAKKIAEKEAKKTAAKTAKAESKEAKKAEMAAKTAEKKAKKITSKAALKEATEPEKANQPPRKEQTTQKDKANEKQNPQCIWVDKVSGSKLPGLKTLIKNEAANGKKEDNNKKHKEALPIKFQLSASDAELAKKYQLAAIKNGLDKMEQYNNGSSAQLLDSHINTTRYALWGAMQQKQPPIIPENLGDYYAGKAACARQIFGLNNFGSAITYPTSIVKDMLDGFVTAFKARKPYDNPVLDHQFETLCNHLLALFEASKARGR